MFLSYHSQFLTKDSTFVEWHCQVWGTHSNVSIVLVARIEAEDIIVLETVGLVDMEFMITRGDRSVITRAFAVTRSLSATEGKLSAYC